MREYTEKMRKNFAELADRAALIDEHGGNISYHEFDVISAKMAAFFHSRGVGKEDFVVIHLPRTIHIYTAVFGAIRIGAAFVALDHFAPEERVKFIAKDCNARLVLEEKDLADALRCEPKMEWVESDLHDAAFAVYTSGTTGMPKGILHERGDFTENVKNFCCDSYHFSADMHKFLNLVPTGYVALQMSMVMFYYGLTYYIAETDRIRDVHRIYDYIKENEIDYTFLPPAVVASIKEFPPCLKRLIISGDKAKDIYRESCNCYHMYSNSEAAAPVTIKLLTEPNDEPSIGRFLPGKGRLIDTDAKGIGEIVEYLPYTRGYIGDAGLTEKKFEGHWFHTGDLARVDEQGDLFFVGRSDQMLKINGNRMEPAEIENVMYTYCGVKWAFVRSETVNGIKILTAYYTEAEGQRMDENAMKAEMRKHLMSCMIPKLFIKLDKIPLNSTGKVDYAHLTVPVRKTAHTGNKSGINSAEFTLLRAMEEIFSLENISPEDDFFELGGDSLCSLMLQTLCAFDELSTDMIYEGRTARRIAELYYEKIRSIDSDKDINETKLLPGQQLMLDEQVEYPESRVNYLFGIYKLNPGVDTERFANAVNTAARKSGALMSALKKKDGEVFQYYAPELWNDTEIEDVSGDEFNGVVRSFMGTFPMFESPLSKFKLIRTNDAAYLILCVHHIVFDGTSVGVLLKNIVSAYEGEELQKDSYYRIVDYRNKRTVTKEYIAAKSYFEENYDASKYQTIPHPDYNRNGVQKCIRISFDIAADELEEAMKQLSVTPNVFFIAATIYTNAEYNGSKDQYISWLFNGRSNNDEKNTVGLLIFELPVAVRKEQFTDIEALFRSVSDQVTNGIRYSCYPYESFSGDYYETNVYYQGDMLNPMRIAGAEKLIDDFEIFEDIHKDDCVRTAHEIEIFKKCDQFFANIYYNDGKYSDESMQAYAELFRKFVLQYGKRRA